MLPVEEKSQNTRNLSLNLNLQNTTQSQTSSDTDPQESDDIMDENTKLLTIERQDYVPAKLNGNGNLIKNGGSKIHYNMNITNNNLCNNNLINNNSIIKNGGGSGGDSNADTETDSVATNENSVNNNEETNSTGDKKIIKMTKLGSKNVTLKRWVQNESITHCDFFDSDRDRRKLRSWSARVPNLVHKTLTFVFTKAKSTSFVYKRHKKRPEWKVISNKIYIGGFIESFDGSFKIRLNGISLNFT